MADDGIDDIKLRFETISKGASLEILLPISRDVDLPNLFSNESDEPLSTIPTRHALFFDESVNVIIVLKTEASRENVDNILPKLELRLAAHATEAVSEGNGGTASTSGKYDLVFTSFRASEDAASFTTGNHVFVLWQASLHVARPRVRLQRAAIYFTTTLTVHVDAVTSHSRQTEYLPAFEPLPSNVLEPLRWDPDLTKSDIYLPENRVTKVAPRTALTQDVIRPIRGTSKRAIPVNAAILSRIRYSVVSDAVIASLHVESSRLVPGHIVVDGIGFEVASCQVLELMDVQLPTSLQPGDDLVILYRLPTASSSGRDTQVPNDGTSLVSISIDASIPLGKGSDVDIRVSWQTQVDLSLSHARPSYRWSRSASLGSYSLNRLSVASYSRPTSYDALVSKVDDQSAAIFTFTGLRTVHQNQAFKLTIHCNNRGHRPRRFALAMLPNKKRRSGKLLQSSTLSDDLNSRIFHQRVSHETRPPDVLGLNADVRVGPFSPGACFQTSIKFRAASTGLLNLGILRIVDLETRQVVDVRELPDVIAVDGLVKSK